MGYQFQSTLPAKGATLAAIDCDFAIIFQSTLPAKGATENQILATRRRFISIHAPREGSDRDVIETLDEREDFNPRSPRRERPNETGGEQHAQRISIHAPREGSDPVGAGGVINCQDFNPRSPRRERPRHRIMRSWRSDFNPRSPRRERLVFCVKKSLRSIFQSTLPAKGATPLARFFGRAEHISIHAPREGSDS